MNAEPPTGPAGSHARNCAFNAKPPAPDPLASPNRMASNTLTTSLLPRDYLVTTSLLRCYYIVTTSYEQAGTPGLAANLRADLAFP